MTSYYIVHNSRTPESDPAWNTALQIFLSNEIANLLPGSRVFREFTVGVVVSTTSQFSSDVVNLELEMSDDGT